MPRHVKRRFDLQCLGERRRTLQAVPDAVGPHAQRGEGGVDSERPAKRDTALDSQVVLLDVQAEQVAVGLEGLAERPAAARAEA